MNPSEQIDANINNLSGWQQRLVKQFRDLIVDQQPDLTPAWKWNTGMWQLGAELVCGYGVFKSHVKFNFFQGALVDDPKKLFNNGFEAKTARSIDLREDDNPDWLAISELLGAAVGYSQK